MLLNPYWMKIWWSFSFEQLIRSCQSPFLSKDQNPNMSNKQMQPSADFLVCLGSRKSFNLPTINENIESYMYLAVASRFLIQSSSFKGLKMVDLFTTICLYRRQLLISGSETCSFFETSSVIQRLVILQGDCASTQLYEENQMFPRLRMMLRTRKMVQVY